MDRVDGYLSRTAQKVHPDALVWVLDDETDAETWVIRRPGHPDIGIGIHFAEARSAVAAIVEQHKNREGSHGQV